MADNGTSPVYSLDEVYDLISETKISGRAKEVVEILEEDESTIKDMAVDLDLPGNLVRNALNMMLEADIVYERVNPFEVRQNIYGLRVEEAQQNYSAAEFHDSVKDKLETEWWKTLDDKK